MTDYLPLIAPAAALIGVIVGATINSWSQERIRRRTALEAKLSLAQGIAAEAESYLKLIQRREIIRYAKEIIRANQLQIVAGAGACPGMVPKMWLSGFEKDNDPFPLLRANFSSVGALGQLSIDVARFYSQVNGIRATMTMADEGRFDYLLPSDIIKIMSTEIEFWQNTERLGWDMINRLRQIRK